MSLEAHRSMDEVHNIGCLLVVREVIRAMISQDPVLTRRQNQARGSIVVLTSGFGRGVPWSGQLYCGQTRGKRVVQTAGKSLFCLLCCVDF